MIRPTFDVGADEAAELLEGLVRVSALDMRKAGPHRPRIGELIRSGDLVYSPIDIDEHWQSYREILGAIEREGIATADCEDLASLVAAQWRVDGVDPDARTFVYQTGPALSHVVVASRRVGHLPPAGFSGAALLGPGWLYNDPSVAAGMRVPGGR